MLKPKPAKVFSAGIKEFNKCSMMAADSLWSCPKDTAGELTMESMRPEKWGSSKTEEVDINST